MKAEGLKLVFSKKMRNKNLRGVSEVRFEKKSTSSPWKRRKPPHPKLSAQRACEG